MIRLKYAYLAFATQVAAKGAGCAAGPSQIRVFSLHPAFPHPGCGQGGWRRFRYVSNTRAIRRSLPFSACLSPHPTSLLALGAKAEQPLLLLVARVRLALRDALQGLLLLCAPATLVRPLANRLQLGTHVVLRQDVVDAEDVRADARVLEALARRAVKLARVALALRDAVRFFRLAHHVHGHGHVEQRLEVHLAHACVLVLPTRGNVCAWRGQYLHG